MALIAKKSSGDFVLCPAGAHLAVCVDVVDLGDVKTKYRDAPEKTQHKIRVVWQVNERTEDGKPFIVRRMYTLSLDDRASLRKDLESWRGRPFTEDELKGFDVESVLGAGCMLSVVHEVNNGKTYDNVNAVMRLPKGMSVPVIEGYVRVKDRPTEGGAPPENAPGDAFEPSDEDVPF
jgi:hypothetical protein